MATIKKIILLALTVLMMVGCAEKNNDGSIHAPYNSEILSPTYNTIMVDSCEYIYGTYSLAHKGNCRFCKERRQKEMKELVEQLKEK